MKIIYICVFLLVIIIGLSCNDDIYKHALDVYTNLGFELELHKLEIRYYSYKELNKLIKLDSLAFYNSEEQIIGIVTFKSFKEINPLGSVEMYNSILFHEFIHYFNNNINPQILPAHDELLACGLQLSILSDELLNQMIDFPYSRFKNIYDVTFLYYIRDSNGFQEASYFFCIEHFPQLKNIILNSHKQCRDPFLIDP